MSTIILNLAGDTATGVTLLSLVNSVTGATIPQSPSLPQPFTNAGGGNWTFAVADPVPYFGYFFQYSAAWQDGTQFPGSDLLLNAPPAPTGPLLATATTQIIGSYHLSAAQGSSPTYTFTFYQSDGVTPVSLFGKVLTFAAFTSNDFAADPVWSQTTGDGSIIISGAGFNVVTVTLKTANAAAAGSLYFQLWDTTDSVVIALGVLEIALGTQL
jgi:hypothetical protein